MSNGPKPMMSQGLQLLPALKICIVPLMTPVLRRSREQRPQGADDDAAPWRDRAPASKRRQRR